MPTKNKKTSMKILGIDPGFADTGFGLVEKERDKLSVIDFGSIKTAAKQDFEKRLLYIYQSIESLIKKYQPDYMAIEQLFFHTNITTAIKVGQARGVLLLAAANNKIPIYEYTPLQIKQSLTGYGKADKRQMGQMVKAILKLEKVPKPDDAADALAAALCCLNTIKYHKLNGK